MKMENPYHTLGEAFVSSIVAGGTGKIQGKQEGLSERLRQYAYYMQENAVEAGDALLVNDLLDAAKRLTPTQTSEAHPMDAGMRRTQETMVRFTNEPQTSGEWLPIDTAPHDSARPRLGPDDRAPALHASGGLRRALVQGQGRGAARALEFVQRLLDAPIPRIALENPVSIISSRIRKPDQIIQPWQFGHGETKATCLWLKNLPKLTPTDVVEGREGASGRWGRRRIAGKSAAALCSRASRVGCQDRPPR
jgi:hypothetical protein